MKGRCVVYVIGNKRLKRCYVGETENIERRLVQHMGLLNSGSHYAKAFQMDYDKYNEIDIINEIDCDKLTVQQRKLIEKAVMLIYLNNGWQLYNSNPIPTKNNLEWHIMYDLLEIIESNLYVHV